jgi:peptide/nickel transport system permease protein
MSEILMSDVKLVAKRRYAFVRRYPMLVVGFVIITTIALLAIFAPFIAPTNPMAVNTFARLKPPSDQFTFGTDLAGRDIFSRVLWGGRISLMVGIGVALLSTLIGTLIGLAAGMNRTLDAIVMRVMDGIMAIPGILVALALVSLARPSILTIIIAITVPDVPRVARLVRSIVLGVSQLPYIDAARSIGTKTPYLVIRHILPSTFGPLTVQATFLAASAIMSEAYLSFLGLGIPGAPSWGGIVAEGRSVIQLAHWLAIYPGIFLGLTVLSINMIGDGLRDILDPQAKYKR